MKKLIHFSWIGPVILVLGTFIFGMLHPGYSHVSQYLSELGADNAPNYLLNNYLTTVPYGISLCLFSLGAISLIKHSKTSLISYIVLFVIGVLFIIFAIFNCEEGCAIELWTTKAKIHFFSAQLAFLLTIVSQILLGLDYFRLNRKKINLLSFLFAIAGIIILVVMVKTGYTSPYAGLFQRLFMANMALWVVFNGILIRQIINEKPISSEK